LEFQKEFDFMNQIYGRSTKTTQFIENRRGLSTSRTTSWRYLTNQYNIDSKLIKNLFEDSRSIIWIDTTLNFINSLYRGKYLFSIYLEKFL